MKIYLNENTNEVLASIDELNYILTDTKPKEVKADIAGSFAGGLELKKYFEIAPIKSLTVNLDMSLRDIGVKEDEPVIPCLAALKSAIQSVISCEVDSLEYSFRNKHTVKVILK